MKILVIANCLDRSETTIFKTLAESDIELDMICNPDAPSFQTLKDAGIQITPLVAKGRLDLNAIKTIRNKIKSGNYDILHALTNRTLSNTLFASRGCKASIVTYRGTMGHISRWDPASWMTYLNPRISKIICVSNAVREYLISMNIPSTRVTTIYKGHDPEWYANFTPTNLSELGIPENSFVIGFVGSMRPVKGVDSLINAMQYIPESVNAQLLLVGECRDNSLKQLAKKSPSSKRIHFTGHRTDAPSLIRSCNAFVMPSVSREGLPRGVIEAMVQEIPTIVTNVGGMPEIVIDKDCGLVVPPKNPQELAKAIIELAEHPEVREKYAKKGKQRIVDQFNINTTIEQIRNLYQELTK